MAVLWNSGVLNYLSIYKHRWPSKSICHTVLKGTLLNLKYYEIFVLTNLHVT